MVHMKKLPFLHGTYKLSTHRIHFYLHSKKAAVLFTEPDTGSVYLYTEENNKKTKWMNVFIEEMDGYKLLKKIHRRLIL